MMSLKPTVRLLALLLSVLLVAGVLSGCGNDSPPNADAEQEIEEPMGTGPMANDGTTPEETPGEGVTE
ncbi:hypothetical protein M0220_11800 [Halomonas qinghailakensis]|uniref:Secreted protein n=2 Tax=Halomonas TaxID=2745 RepID=A0AA46YN34_9GAMM|nr:MULTISPECIES: hypothetical protein [Halomonas]UYO73566.1 hypothetical protein M0220_11800 [Halomonas sp. ZZQ-149]UYV18344.1 hypothetical protein K1Y77_12765 [Halomonas qaidamensis]